MEEITKSILDLQDEFIKSRTKGAKDINPRKRWKSIYSGPQFHIFLKEAKKRGHSQNEAMEMWGKYHESKKSIFDLQDEVIEKASIQVKEYQRTRAGKRETVHQHARSWEGIAKEVEAERQRRAKAKEEKATGKPKGGKTEDTFRVPAVPPLKGLKVDEYRSLLKQGHTWRDIKAMGSADAARAKISESAETKKETTQEKPAESKTDRQKRWNEAKEKGTVDEKGIRHWEFEGIKFKTPETPSKQEGKLTPTAEGIKKIREKTTTPSKGRKASEAIEEMKKRPPGELHLPEQFKETHKLGKIVKIGGEEYKISAIGEKGFTAINVDDDTEEKKVSWSSITGYGTPEKPPLGKKEKAEEMLGRIKSVKGEIGKLEVSKEVKQMSKQLDNLQSQLEAYLGQKTKDGGKVGAWFKTKVSNLVSKLVSNLNNLTRRLESGKVKDKEEIKRYKEEIENKVSRFSKWLKNLVGGMRGKKFKFTDEQKTYVQKRLKELEIAKKFKEGRKKGLAKIQANRAESKQAKEEPKKTGPLTEDEFVGLRKMGYTDDEIKRLGGSGGKAAYWNKIKPEDSGLREEKKAEEKKESKVEELSRKRKAGYQKYLEAKRKQKEVVKKSMGGRKNIEEDKMLGKIAGKRGEKYFVHILRPSERKMLEEAKALKTSQIKSPKSEWKRVRRGRMETVHRVKNIILRRPKQSKIPEA